MNMQRIGAAAGILAPIVAFTCILVAIESYPKFSWTNNALSDLGVVNGVSGPLFNFGLYVCGFLAVIFAVLSLYSYFGKNIVGKVGAGFFVAASTALICIGVFNENFSPTHYLVSVAFFVLLPISLFIFTVAFELRHQAKMSLLTIAVALVAAAPWILYFTLHYVVGVAIPETISGLAGSLWIIVLGFKIQKQK